jgi:ABC-type lipoprotein release transport system permease subunit
MGVAPLILAGALAAGAVASLCLTLAASVRRRRAGLALLKTLGLTGRQLATTAACQSTVTVAADALIGVRLGIALGRYL